MVILLILKIADVKPVMVACLTPHPQDGQEGRKKTFALILRSYLAVRWVKKNVIREKNARLFEVVR